MLENADRLAGSCLILCLLAPPARAQGTGGEAKKKEWPKEIKPFVIGDKDGPGTLRLAMTVQALIRLDFTDIDQPGKMEYESQAQLRRLRFYLSGHLITPDFTYQLHLSALPGSLELLDLYLDYQLHPQARLRAGLLKIPFTRYRTNSFSSLSMVDWFCVTEYFGAERQLGVILHNGYGKDGLIEYELGLLTGVASRPPHARGLSKLYGETMPNRSDLTSPSIPTSIHPEIVAHVAWNHGGYQHAPEADIDGGAPRLSLGASVAWDARPVAYEDLSLRLSPEIWLKAYGLALHVTGYFGFVALGRDLSYTNLALAGAVARIGYCIKGRMEIAAQYAVVHATNEVRTDARARADSIIGAADPEDLDTLTSKYESAGALRRKQEAGLGVTVFVIGQALKWTTEAVYVLTTSGGADRHDMRVRSQLQLAF